jgi:hypothetical protein
LDLQPPHQQRALFREVNERLRHLNTMLGLRDGSYDIVCECEDGECLQRVKVPVGVYDAVRDDPSRFVVAPGHEGGAPVESGGETYRVIAFLLVA